MRSPPRKEHPLLRVITHNVSGGRGAAGRGIHERQKITFWGYSSLITFWGHMSERILQTRPLTCNKPGSRRCDIASQASHSNWSIPDPNQPPLGDVLRKLMMVGRSLRQDMRIMLGFSFRELWTESPNQIVFNALTLSELFEGGSPLRANIFWRNHFFHGFSPA